ncbi:hypothetical protein CH371_11430 [Leptospira wolffii]|uniref:DinB family protein n=1 Tax=Leptospira wolffii TaxID=409998 RepID=A0A2M9ZB25_9LEPT|nr:hypothetical protein [Leptospira wolffii]PJZ65547.1 hypothetical protein CH371_11430 [Leptospira wolffii]
MIEAKPAVHSSLEAAFLRLADLARRIPDRNYSRPLPLLSGATIGKQIRHCLEVGEALLNGWETGRISYDRRARNPIFESSNSAASIRLEELAYELKDKIGDKEITVAHISDPASGTEEISDSSWERELLYVREHTIHHEAILKVALQHDLGFDDLPESFGFAVSTLRHHISVNSYTAWDPVI